MVDQLQEIVVLFEQVKETFESQDSMLDLVTVKKPNEATVQNTDNVIWYPVEMQRPVQTGWDMTGNETDIIKEGYPITLNDSPDNDVVVQRIDDLRNDMFMKEAIKASGKKLASNLNSNIAQTMVNEGSLFYRATDTSGFDFVTRGQVTMDERQLVDNMRYMLMNPTTARKFGTDLAARETVSGRPEAVWKKGYIASDVAGFDIMKGNFLPNIAGGTSTTITVTGNQSFAPEGFNTSTGANVDYRSAVIPVSASAGFEVGDKITFSNSGTTVKALGKDDKTVTGSAMTFTIVAKPSGTSIEVYPKPIANDDSALSVLEKGYSNVDTTILNGATITRLNTDTSVQTNLFWDKESVVVMGGNLPAEKFNLGGNRVVSDTLSNGLELYLVYYTNPATATVSYRFMLWYGIDVCVPANCGVCISA